jgi:DNA repair exonuclease SbcCD ATPase subunit
MKLKEITLRGFRGFNGERTIPIHDRLTLISAPNSHGKTSISEAFEWLLYGYTSKVANADSKDEYKGSYRNIHFLQPESPSVRVVVEDANTTMELLALLSGC